MALFGDAVLRLLLGDAGAHFCHLRLNCCSILCRRACRSTSPVCFVAFLWKENLGSHEKTSTAIRIALPGTDGASSGICSRCASLWTRLSGEGERDTLSAAVSAS
jgi:hypothetical protein